MSEKKLFCHLGGCVVKEGTKVLHSTLFSTSKQVTNRQEQKNNLEKKYDATLVENPAQIQPFLLELSKKIDRKLLRKINLELTKESIKQSVTPDILAIQSLKSIEEIDRVIQLLSKRLLEWITLFFPGVDITQETLSQLRSNDVEDKTSMGSVLSQDQHKQIKLLSEQIIHLQTVRENILVSMDSTLMKYCPNLCTVTGTLTTAKLLEHSGSLRKLMELPSSTIQVLGAEKALFRHLKTGSRPPKYGLLFSHEIVQNVVKEKQGKAARLLADKISIAAKIDYFKGEFQGDTLVKDLKEKLS